MNETPFQPMWGIFRERPPLFISAGKRFTRPEMSPRQAVCFPRCNRNTWFQADAHAASRSKPIPDPSVQAATPQVDHGIAGRPDTGENDVAGPGQNGGVAGNPAVFPDMVEGPGHTGQVARPVIHNRDHSL